MERKCRVSRGEVSFVDYEMEGLSILILLFDCWLLYVYTIAILRMSSMRGVHQYIPGSHSGVLVRVHSHHCNSNTRTHCVDVSISSNIMNNIDKNVYSTLFSSPFGYFLYVDLHGSAFFHAGWDNKSSIQQ